MELSLGRIQQHVKFWDSSSRTPYRAVVKPVCLRYSSRETHRHWSLSSLIGYLANGRSSLCNCPNAMRFGLAS
eukprot:2265730-Pyramimonas_sp.AAC.1